MTVQRMSYVFIRGGGGGDNLLTETFRFEFYLSHIGSTAGLIRAPY